MSNTDLLGDPIPPAPGEQADTTSALVEALEAVELALRMGISAAEILDEHSPIRDGIRAALAAHRKEIA